MPVVVFLALFALVVAFSTYVGSVVGRSAAVSPALLLSVPVGLGVLYVCSNSTACCVVGLGSGRTYRPLDQTRTSVRGTWSPRPWQSGGPGLR